MDQFLLVFGGKFVHSVYKNNSPTMKNHLSILASTIICLGLLPAYSQPGPRGGAPGGPHLGGATGKLFGDNQAFSAGLEMQVTDKSGQPMTMPGKISFDTGKTRFEVNLADMKGGQMPPNAAEQMKSMGMDQVVSISRPDKKTAYVVYPGLQSYAEVQPSKADSAPPNSDYKVEITEIGKETVDGHPCVKNKVVVTDKEGTKHESTVWNATDLKKFPVKIQTTEQSGDVTMLFKNVTFAKPAASLFDPPADFKKYDSMQQMMQQEMMKRMGGGVGMPPH
jgi:hypothetical protein